MNTFKFGDRETVYEFFRNRLGLSRTDDFRGALYVPIEFQGQTADMDHVAIAVGYNNFNGNLCSMHTVIQKPEFMNRTIIREAFEFPFIRCARTHIIAPVDSTNEAALNFDKKLGFKEVYRFPEGGLDGDMVILTMSKEECRWLGKEREHGKRQPRYA